MGKSLDIYHQNAALYEAVKDMEGVALTMAQAHMTRAAEKRTM